MKKDDILNNQEIKLAIILKTNQLKREALPTISYQHVYDTLLDFKWNNNYPESIHEAINDIMSLDVSEIVGYLSLDAIKKGAKMKVSDLEHILKGEVYE